MWRHGRLVPGARFSPTMLTLVFATHVYYYVYYHIFNTLIFRKVRRNISKENYYTGKMKNSSCKKPKIVVLGWKGGWLSKQRDYVLIMFGDRQFGDLTCYYRENI